MTIVMVIGPDDDPEATAAPVRSLGAHHPCRAVLLRADPDSTPVIDAKACLWRAEPAAARRSPGLLRGDPHPGRGQAASHLASIAGPFVLADLPVVMWFPGALPDPTDPLFAWPPPSSSIPGPSPRAIGNWPFLPDPARAGQPPTRRRPVVGPPAAVAGAAGRAVRTEHTVFPPRASALARVSGKPGPSPHAGGLAHGASSTCRARELVLTDAKHVDITLEAVYRRRRRPVPGEAGTMGRARCGPGPRFRAAVATARRCLFPTIPLTSALSAAISNLRADRVWERALAAAAAGFVVRPPNSATARYPSRRDTSGGVDALTVLTRR